MSPLVSITLASRLPSKECASSEHGFQLRELASARLRAFLNAYEDTREKYEGVDEIDIDEVRNHSQAAQRLARFHPQPSSPPHFHLTHLGADL